MASAVSRQKTRTPASKQPRRERGGEVARPEAEEGNPDRSGKVAKWKAPHPNARTFRATLEPDHTSLKWTVARLPFDCSAVWPHMLRRRVAGTVNGVPFRTSLFPAGNSGAQILLVNKQMQAAAGAHSGQAADFVLWPDLDPRPATLPDELLTAFEGDHDLELWTLQLSESNRREITKWIAVAKSSEARHRRAQQMAERLLLVMEGERQTSPILAALFARNPKVRTGWDAMTPYQRRSHLLGIFYYQTPEARTRRAQKAVDDALRIAAKI